MQVKEGRRFLCTDSKLFPLLIKWQKRPKYILYYTDATFCVRNGVNKITYLYFNIFL